MNLVKQLCVVTVCRALYSDNILIILSDWCSFTYPVAEIHKTAGQCATFVQLTKIAHNERVIQCVSVGL